MSRLSRHTGGAFAPRRFFPSFFPSCSILREAPLTCTCTILRDSLPKAGHSLLRMTANSRFIFAFPISRMTCCWRAFRILSS